MNIEKKEFKLQDEYITLVNLLKVLDVISSGGEIRYYINDDQVYYNNEIEHRKRKKIYKGDIVEIKNKIKITII